MLAKEKVIEAVRTMPDQFSLDDLVERLVVLEKIETGLRQAAEGKTLATQEARQKMGIS